jgi:hypothetical protein
MEERIMEKRVSINVTKKTAEARMRLVKAVFDHPISADVAEKRLVEMAKKYLESTVRGV